MSSKVVCADSPTSYAPTPAFPYGTHWSRWIRPIFLALVLVAIDEQGLLAGSLAAFLVLVYLPRSLLAEKFKDCRKERLTRFFIYIVAIVLVFGLRMFNTSLAGDRAEKIIAATEQYKNVHGDYPDSLEQLVPRFVPEIPAKAKLSLMDNGFRYDAKPGSHTLMYVAMPPFGRRIYQFESAKWKTLD